MARDGGTDEAVEAAEFRLDLDQLLVFNLVRTYHALGPFLDGGLRAQRLTASQLNTLLILRRPGRAGLRMGEIGRRLVVTKSNVTRLVDRLEAEGLVARAGQRDRRATAIRLTPAGRRLLACAAPRHARRLARLTTCLSAADKRGLIRGLAKLRRGLRPRREGAP